jgi:hypothetical protein
VGKVRRSLEIAHRNGKRFALWAIFYPPATDFLHIYYFANQKRQQIWGFPAIRGLAADLQ